MSAIARRQHTAATAAWAVAVAMALGGLVLIIFAWNDLVTGDAITTLCDVPAAVLYATLGALIVRRAGNVIGWYLAGAGIAVAAVGLASAYAVLGISNPGTLPEPRVVGLLGEWSFVPLVCGIAFMFLLFPTGHLPSPRWRPVGALCVLLIALTMIGFLIHPRMVALPAPGGISLTFQNPLGVHSLPGTLARVLIGTINDLWVVFIALLAVSTAAMTIRYRSGGRELRQQIKWIAFTAAAAIGCSIVVLASMPIGGKSWAWLTTVADVVVTVIGLAGFPIAIAVAILKYGLYQIDVIINRAVSYGLLSAALTAVYAGIVVGIGAGRRRRDRPVLSRRRGDAVLLHTRGAPEHREVCAGLARHRDVDSCRRQARVQRGRRRRRL